MAVIRSAINIVILSPADPVARTTRKTYGKFGPASAIHPDAATFISPGLPKDAGRFAALFVKLHAAAHVSLAIVATAIVGCAVNISRALRNRHGAERGAVWEQGQNYSCNQEANKREACSCCFHLILPK